MQIKAIANVLPKSMRLKGHRCFDHLYREGRRYHETSILLRVVKADPRLFKIKNHQSGPQSCRCAIAISSKVNKRAVIRNRLRRLLHQHLIEKLSGVSEHSNKWLLFSLKPQSSNKKSSQLLNECNRLLLKAGLVL